MLLEINFKGNRTVDVGNQFLALPEELRAFIGDLAKAAGSLSDTFDFLGLLADYLEENGNRQAVRFRKLTLEDGDVFVFYTFVPDKRAHESIVRLEQHAEKTGKTIFCLTSPMPNHKSLQSKLRGQHVPSKALIDAGWDRESSGSLSRHIEDLRRIDQSFADGRPELAREILQEAIVHHQANLRRLRTGLNSQHQEIPGAVDLANPPGESACCQPALPSTIYATVTDGHGNQIGETVELPNPLPAVGPDGIERWED